MANVHVCQSSLFSSDVEHKVGIKEAKWMKKCPVSANQLVVQRQQQEHCVLALPLNAAIVFVYVSAVSTHPLAIVIEWFR